MRLFIQVENGQPVNHPIREDNLKQAFRNIDLENLPPNFAKFVRIERPVPGMFEVVEGPTYEWNGEAFEDTYTIRAMTEEEKAQKMELIRIAQATVANATEENVLIAPDAP